MTQVQTAYGNRLTDQLNLEKKTELMSQVSDRLTIRNPDAKTFAKELAALVNKYPLIR